jgi:hypothetical protein
VSATSRQQLPWVTEFGICGLFAARATFLAWLGMPVQYAVAGTFDDRVFIEPSPVVQAAIERARKGGSA